jgi:hypothetical protein
MSASAARSKEIDEKAEEQKRERGRELYRVSR